MEVVTIILASSVPIILVGGLVNRCIVTSETSRGNVVRGKGIGWQFIRFAVLTTAMPIIAILALRGIVDSEAAYALLAAGIGYAFGKTAGGAD